MANLSDDKNFVSQGRELWEDHARWWQDNFTEGADPEYVEQILPTIARYSGAARSILEIGTGEGQVLRSIADQSGNASRRLVGIDPAHSQISVAKSRSEVLAPARAEAAKLPFVTGSFDLVIACLVFEHILDVDSAIAEVSRVLEPGGRFLFLLNHPLLQTPGSGWIDDQVLEEQYWRIGPYLTEDVTVEEVQKDIFIPFVHRPLGRYINALISSGLSLVAMEEPPPPPGFVAQAWEYQESVTIPRLLVLVLEKRG